MGEVRKSTKLGIVLVGEEAQEFLKNEKSVTFTPEQLEFFRKAKRIYKDNRDKFE